MPLYETEEHRRTEEIIAEKIRNLTGLETGMTPTTHPADIEIFSPGSSPETGLRGFCEVKGRNHIFGRFGTIIEGVDKIDSLQRLAARYEVPVLYVVVDALGETYWKQINPAAEFRRSPQMGRTRDQRRPADRRPCYDLDVRGFDNAASVLYRAGLRGNRYAPTTGKAGDLAD